MEDKCLQKWEEKAEQDRGTKDESVGAIWGVIPQQLRTIAGFNKCQFNTEGKQEGKQKSTFSI